MTDNNNGTSSESSTRFSRFFKSKNKSTIPEQKPSKPSPVTVEEGLDKSRNNLFSKIGNVFKGSFNLDDALFEELEESLISCDIGIEASFAIVEQLRLRIEEEKIKTLQGVMSGLCSEITETLKIAEQPWSTQGHPYVVLVVGVNGVGKTTTTAKIAHQLQNQGLSVMLAAADTFRAAAVEQIQEWGRRLNIPVISQQHGSDAAAVAHDALTSAIARNTDVLLIDTAGRLHTQSDLMEQLQKVSRVLKKINPNCPHEVLQVLDAGTGQNAVLQLDQFKKMIQVTSLCLTKLDGSAKGGVAIALTRKHKLPIRYIGIGESIGDLRAFKAKEFAQALVKQDGH